MNDGLWDDAVKEAPERIRDVLLGEHPPCTGTMRDWMQTHHGQSVHTIRVTPRSGHVRTTLSRTVDAESYATYVLLGEPSEESYDEYVGTRVLAAGPNVLIVEHTNGRRGGPSTSTSAYITVTDN